MKYRPEFFNEFLLKLSMIGEFNDPFELTPASMIESMTEEEFAAYDEIASQHPSSYETIDDQLDVSCGVRVSIGVICFTQANDNQLMWAHYADSHEGLCLEFDSSSTFFNGQHGCSSYQNVGTLMPVKYSQERPTYLMLRELADETESWFTKSEAWDYEEEMRLLLPNDNEMFSDVVRCHQKEGDNGERLSFYQTSPKDIKSVILGCRMKDNIKKQIFEKCQSIGVHVKEAKPSRTEFKLVISDYLPN